MTEVQKVHVRQVPKGEREERQVATVRIVRHIPPGAPAGIVARPATGDAAMLRYLCPRCGQDGEIGREWMTHAGVEDAAVRCPECFDVMRPR
jgi:hypothetical protein